MAEATHRGSTYLEDAWNMDGMAEWALDQLPGDVDTLVGIGMSGCLIVPRLADSLGLKWGVVRKAGVRSHGETESGYEGQMGRSWALVDDFMCTGDTVINAVKGVDQEFMDRGYWGQWTTRFTGALFYRRWERLDPATGGRWADPADLLREMYGDNRRALELVINRQTAPTVAG